MYYVCTHIAHYVYIYIYIYICVRFQKIEARRPDSMPRSDWSSSRMDSSIAPATSRRA